MTVKMRMIASGLLTLAAIGCGKAKSSAASATPAPVDTQVPVVTDVTPAPTATPAATVAPVVAPVAKFWFASAGGGGRVLAGYSSTGALVTSYDLSNQLSGAITAMTFLNTNNLLLFVDPGASGEVIANLNISTGVLTNNLVSNAVLNATTVNDMVAIGGQDLYVSKSVTAGSVERFYINLDNITNTRYGAPYPIGATIGGCTTSTVNQTVQSLLVNGVQALGILGSGAASKLNVFGALDTSTFTCVGNMAVNAVNLPAATTTIPSGSFFDTAASKLYVRYTFTAAPQGIYSYDYNVTTGALSGAAATYVNLGILGAVATSRGLLELDATSMLVPEFTGNVVHKISKAGVYQGIFAKSTYTTGIAASATRP